MKECAGFIGDLMGHKYEAVYEYSEPKIKLQSMEISEDGMIAILEASKSKTYIGHICKRCGDITRKDSHGKE